MSDQVGTETQGPVGVGMFVAAYVNERGADQKLEALKIARERGQFLFDDAAVVRRDVEGSVHIHETGDMSAGRGAGIGALIGGVLGIVGGPAGVAIGAGAGAGIGGLAAHADAGFDDESLSQLGSALPVGTSALVVTTSQDFVEAVRERAAVAGETLTLARGIAAQVENHLGAGQDVLLAMALTEAGVAASKVVSSPDELAVFGIASAEGGVVACAGVVTDEGAAVVDAAAVPSEEAGEDEVGAGAGEEGQG